MHIGKRLFPYPVLNNTRLYSQFKNATFELQYEELVTDETYSLQNIRCDIQSEYLISLIESGKAKIVVVVECPSTMLRRHYFIGLAPTKIVIPIADLNGKTSISAFVVASENIDDYFCDDFLDDYSGYSFSIEKNDILAIDDGFINRIDFDEEKDNKKSSIFLVIKDKTIKDESMKVDWDSEKVTIFLPETQWNSYEATKRISKFRNLHFSILVVPALSYAIQEVRRLGTLDQLRLEYRWFNAFLSAYKSVNEGKDLTDEEFINMNVILEVQKLVNMPVTKALDDIFELTVGAIGGEDDAD